MHAPLAPALLPHSKPAFLRSWFHGTGLPGWQENAAILLAMLALGLISRAITFSNPIIGLDEQFYLLVGDRMLGGALPYVDIFDRKPIGLFLIYAGAAALPGGDGFLAYKLVALAFVALTSLGVYRLARRLTGAFGALIAASLFLLWHGYMGGEGGQSPIFYDLFTVIAALCVVRAMERPARLLEYGAAAMLAIGIAIQIKYSVLFEGVFFGCALLLLAWRGGAKLSALAISALVWIGAALTPTALALGYYAAIGHADAFIFCNFLSVMAQGRNPVDVQLRDLAEIFAILSPLFVILGVGLWRGGMPRGHVVSLFVKAWFVVSVAGLLLYWRFNNPHYAIPVLLPLLVWMAPIFEAPRRRPWVSIAMVGIALVVGQLVLAANERRNGGGREAIQAVAAARSGAGCSYIYSGYPALYMLTGSCLPSAWAFPGSLNMKDEESAAAVGVDPAAEVARIMAARPPVVIDELPRNAYGNRATRAVVDRELGQHYRLAACTPIGTTRALLVYRRKSDGGASAASGCDAGELERQQRRIAARPAMDWMSWASPAQARSPRTNARPAFIRREADRHRAGTVPARALVSQASSPARPE